MHDLSHHLDDSTQVYPGDPVFKSGPYATISKDGYNVLQLHMGTHTGTHIDAPAHTVEGGKTIDQLDLGMLVGKVVVIDVTSKGARESIAWSDLKDYTKLISPGSIVFFKTGWSRFWKTPRYLEHPYISGEVANNLLSLGVKVVGVDSLNPDMTPADGQESD